MGHRPLDPTEVSAVHPSVVGQLLLGELPIVPETPKVGRKNLAKVHVPSQPICGLIAHGFKAPNGKKQVAMVQLAGVRMFDYIFANRDGWTVVQVVAMLTPALVAVWIIMTVTPLHKREVYFWSLGSTWTSVIACPIALVIMSLSSWSQLHDPSVSLFHGPIIAGTILYIVAFAYAIFYNYNITKSAVLAISTGMLQQLAVLGVIFLFLRWRGNEVNRGR